MTHLLETPATQRIRPGQDIRLIGPPSAKIRILCFHGGGGVGGDPSMLDGFGRMLTQRGDIAMAVARYRVRNTDADATLADMFDDADAALRWAKDSVGDGALWVLGASFGGLLALDAVLKNPQGVAGLILLNPVTDTSEGGYSNRVVDPAVHGDLSPLARYKDHPVLTKLRCLIVHGTGDDVVPVDASRAFAAIWPKARCTLVELPNAAHGFFNRAPRNGETVRHIQSFVAEKPARLPRDVRLLCCIGGQKAGTSWLYDHIAKAPQVHNSTIKERHYFDVLWLNEGATFLSPKVDALKRSVARLIPNVTQNNRASLRDAARLIEHLAPYTSARGDHTAYISALTKDRGQASVVCDFTPSYCGLSAAHFAEISRLGDVRFLFVLRDPVARMWSQIRMKIASEGGDDMAARCQTYAEDLLRKGRMGTLYRADYARTLAALDQGARNSLVVFYDDLFRQETVDKIARFSGIDAVPIEARKRINAGVTVPLPDDLAARMTGALAAQYEAVMARFGTDVPQAWQDRYTQRTNPAATIGAPARRLLSSIKQTVAGAADRPEIAFLHIPKTAGQSIVQELRRVCGGAAISPVRTHTQADQNAQFPPGYRVYAGHLDWMHLDQLSPECFSFSVLRNPRERIASFYFYLLREAQTLSIAELARVENTGKHNILALSADAYFFGGNQRWQTFVQDHFNNFYCSFFATQKMRGRTQIKDLSDDRLLARAIKGASKISKIYGLGELAHLENDLGDVMGQKINLKTTRVNAGPPTQCGSRWDDLMARLQSDENREKLTSFVRHDDILMDRLGLGAELG